MASLRKFAAPLLCLALICGAAFLWPVYKQKASERKLADAARACRVLAEQGDANAQGRLGYMYFEGKGVPRDYAESAR